MSSEFEFTLPDVGEGITGAEIIKWHLGDTIEEDEPLSKAETDKTTVENPVPYDGAVATLYAESEHGIFGTPIINHYGYQPDSSPPVAVDEETVEVRKLRLTLSYDHRIIDGPTADQSMKTVIQGFEDPDVLLARLWGSLSSEHDLSGWRTRYFYAVLNLSTMIEYTFSADIEPQYRDLDPNDHVNQAVYTSYCEQTRAKYWQEVIDQRHDRAPVALVKSEFEYTAELTLGETVTVYQRSKSSVSRVSRSRMNYELMEKLP